MPTLDKAFIMSLSSKQASFSTASSFAGHVMLNPICFGNGHIYIKNFACDTYSYLGLKSVISNTMLGRYCSIASKVHIGIPRHKAVINFNAESFKEGWGFALHHQEGTTTEHLNCNGFDKNQSYEISQDLGFSCHALDVVKIGHDVWIGEGASILEGVNIGTGAVIGAGSMITKDAPPYAIVVGFDRHLKNRFSDEVIADLLASQWWECQ